METSLAFQNIELLPVEEIKVLIDQLESGMQDILKVEKNLPRAVKMQELIGMCIDLYTTKKFGIIL